MALLITPRALAQRGEFYYQLSAMIRAGLPLIGALQTLEKNPPNASYRKPVARMLAELKNRNTFVSALDTVGDWLPSEFTRGITTLVVGAVMFVAVGAQVRRARQRRSAADGDTPPQSTSA